MPDKTLIAYHGNPQLKAKILAQITAHREADEILQGAYYRTDGKVQVCAVGCVLHDPNGGHEQYEPEFGIPSVLAHLEDGMFESMELEHAKEWPYRFMNAIQPGADLSGVWPRLIEWMMIDEKWGLVNIVEAPDVKAVVQRVGEAYRRMNAGEVISDAEQKEITDATRAAWAARDARAAWAARAARDARDAWDARDARDAFVVASADKLIELLEAAPVPVTA